MNGNPDNPGTGAPEHHSLSDINQLGCNLTGRLQFTLSLLRTKPSPERPDPAGDAAREIEEIITLTTV